MAYAATTAAPTLVWAALPANLLPGMFLENKTHLVYSSAAQYCPDVIPTPDSDLNTRKMWLKLNYFIWAFD
jgi:hypothetical protein